MNDRFREVKARLRQLDLVLDRGGYAHVELAQAISHVRRLVKRGDRSREPSSEIVAGLDKAEALGRSFLAG